jgi:acetoin utilization deacetylase AcuC-like enzyme
MKTVGYLYDPLFLEHTYPGHPESDARLRAVINLLRQENAFDELTALSCIPATEAELAQVHRPDYIAEVMSIAGYGGGHLGADTYLTDASYDAAALAAGAAMRAAQAVLQGEVDRAFALVRPPGHHAFADHGEGFCIFNNIAFATKEALKTCERVMIVDFDVHHGNGTQAIFYEDPRALFVSSHQMPLYPGSGHLDEVGRGAGRGATVNVPLLPGAGDGAFSRVLVEVITPLAQRFKPQLLLVSAGFDAHWHDPLAQLGVSLTGFAEMVSGLCQLSEEFCNGRMVCILEGGYDLPALSYGVLNTFKLLRGHEQHEVIKDPFGREGGKETDMSRVMDAVKALHQL